MRLTLTGCAVFICYAMDKDTHSVTNAEVHEVFSQVRESPLPFMTLFPSSAVFLCLTFSNQGTCIWVEIVACSLFCMFGVQCRGRPGWSVTSCSVSTALEDDLDHDKEQHVDLVHEALCTLPRSVCKVPQDQCLIWRLLCPL